MKRAYEHQHAPEATTWKRYDVAELRPELCATCHALGYYLRRIRPRAPSVNEERSSEVRERLDDIASGSRLYPRLERHYALKLAKGLLLLLRQVILAGAKERYMLKQVEPLKHRTLNGNPDIKRVAQQSYDIAQQVIAGTLSTQKASAAARNIQNTLTALQLRCQYGEAALQFSDG